jgi:hypothetical protein
LGFIRDLYNSEHIRFTSVDEMSEDIMRLAELKLQLTNRHLATADDDDDI